MSLKFIILGCGSSMGVPRPDGSFGNCNPTEKKNYRTRCSAIISSKYNNTLIDTSPDLRFQLLQNNIKKIDRVLYSHFHADQTHGINELRPFFWKYKRKINIYGDIKTINILKNQFAYCFKKSTSGYPAILKSNIINKSFSLGKNNESIEFKTLSVQHGRIKSLGYIFQNVAYISDCNKIPKDSLKNLYNLEYLVLDCLRMDKHPSHFNYYEALKLIKLVKPKKAILTNLHTDLDYDFLKKNLPSNILPAYDGLSFNF